jgi:hypothetical protein
MKRLLAPMAQPTPSAEDRSRALPRPFIESILKGSKGSMPAV